MAIQLSRIHTPRIKNLDYASMNQESSGQSSGAPNRPTGPKEHAVLTEVASFALSFGRKLGDLTLKNVAAVVAFSVVVFYLVGLVRRIAQLHEIRVPTNRGVPLAPLQDYLISGLAVIVNPANLYTLLLIALGVVLILLLPKTSPRIAEFFAMSDEDPADPPQAATTTAPSAHRSADAQSPQGSTDRGVRIFAPAVGVVIAFAAFALPVAVALLIPVRTFGPWLAILTIIVVLYRLNRRYNVIPIAEPRRWSGTHAGIVASAFVAMLLTMALVIVWFDPPPLDAITIERTTGGNITGRLIAQANGAVYIAERPEKGSKETDVTVVPMQRIETFHISSVAPRYYKTVPELLGWRFWRYTPRDGNWQLTRSTRTNRSIWKQLED